MEVISMNDQDEILAEQLVRRYENQLLENTSDPALKGKTGRLEVLEDMNCCAPTNQILFAFQMDGSRKVMNAATLLSQTWVPVSKES